MIRTISFLLLWFLLPLRLRAVEETVSVPLPPREMRAAWIATVANIDWPSKPGLPVAQQKAELVALLEHAAQLHLNAVFFQVRPVADAFYASPFEPWSEYLTGTQGKAPQPFYDPLALAVAEAHQRGLAIHAWFNPFRAGHPEAKSPSALNHVVRTHPELVRHYGRQIWLDPGEPEARARAVNSVLDVVKRYDVDGVVFDDYFYPYPEKNGSGKVLEFPDDASWFKYGVKSGQARDDWRRANINQFIQKISQSVHAAKPWVQFGVSPFGIWRPGVPAGISPKALDAYGRLYADGRGWLANGWVDYLAPQLYWAIGEREESFPALLQWWRQQNSQGRHVYAAVNAAAVGTKFAPDEIARQIQVVRAQGGGGGEVHYHLRSILENGVLAAAVRSQYAQAALLPVTPWLAAATLEKPRLVMSSGKNGLGFRWEENKSARGWLWQTCFNQVWTTEILPAGETAMACSARKPDLVVLRAVDRLGNLSEPTKISTGRP